MFDGLRELFAATANKKNIFFFRDRMNTSHTHL